MLNFYFGGRHTKSIPISKIKQKSKNKGHDLVIISLFYWYKVCFGALLGENVALYTGIQFEDFTAVFTRETTVVTFCLFAILYSMSPLKRV